MDVRQKEGDVGVIVGRFQVPYLHDAHKDLIQTVVDKHQKVIIFLGLSPARVTIRNPLDFEARKQMILDSFPDVNVLYVKDMKDDIEWSKQLDEKISDLIGPSQTPLLYGSRDSFISHYHGRYTTVELIPNQIISGTELRKEASHRVKCCPEFREGVIWAASNQWPKTWPTIDAAILDETNQKVLLGRKPYEKQYRFIGGFVDPTDVNLEYAVRREVQEETGNIEIGNITYICSSLIDDWRYEDEIDKIMTSLFACNILFGSPTPSDDICELKWFSLKEFIAKSNILVDDHKILMDNLIKELTRRGISFN